jgi:hypothetical protein
MVACAAASRGRAAPAAAPPAAKAAAAPAVAWDDMTKEQRGKYMKEVVTPKMKVVFQEFDPVMFKKFDCTTCHGKDPKARKFKMPGPDVHVLPGTPAAFQAMMAKKPTWPKFTKFMSEKVEPPMATMLGQPLFDPKNPKAGGFGCQDCHMIDKGEPSPQPEAKPAKP